MTSQIAIALGAAGAFVDVSSYIRGTEGVAYQRGRTDPFQDPTPGQFTFTLENQDGRFTPGIVNAYGTVFAENTPVCWAYNGRLVAGIVTGFSFGSDEENWGRLTVTCGEQTAKASRVTISDFSADLGAATSWAYARCTDVLPGVLEYDYHTASQGGELTSVMQVVGGPITTGVQMGGISGDNGITIAPYLLGNGTPTSGGVVLVSTPVGLGTITSCAIGAHFSLVAADSILQLAPVSTASVAPQNIAIAYAVDKISVINGSTAATIASCAPQIAVGETHYTHAVLTLAGTTLTVAVYLDGVQVLTASLAMGSGITLIPAMEVLALSPTLGAVAVRHLYVGPTAPLEAAADTTTWQARFAALCLLVDGLTVGTLDPKISAALLAPKTESGATAWTGICDLLRTEQGEIYMSTSGTLTAPVPVVNVRARTRPATPTATFDAQADLSNVPAFVRDASNMFGALTASGPVLSDTETSAFAISRVGNATQQDTVDLANINDLAAYAQDRLLRGAQVYKLPQIVIDARTSSAAAATAAAALQFGDRVTVSNLPASQLAVSSWDGWVVGINEVHAFDQDVFTIALQPAFPDLLDAITPAPLKALGVFDTARFAFTATSDRTDAGYGTTAAKVVTASPATGTSIEVQTSEPISQSSSFLVQVAAPPSVAGLAREVMQVTAATAPFTDPTYGTVQTLTVTRSVNGVAPVDLNGKWLQVYPEPVFAF